MAENRNTDLSNKLNWQKSHPDLSISVNLDYDPASIWEIPSVTDATKRLPFYVQEIGRTLAKQDYYVRRKGLPSYMLCYIKSGALHLRYSGQIYELRSDDFFLIDCNILHELFLPQSADSVDCYFIHFSGSGALPYIDYFQTLQSGPCCHLDPGNVVLTYIQRLLHIYTQKKQSVMIELEASTLLSNACYAIIEAVRSQAKTKIPEVIGEIRDYLDAHYSEKITLSQLSDYFHISPSYLQKQFKKYVGISPQEFLMQTRIAESKKLLRQTRHSIETISAQAGFADSSYFVHVFHTAENMTPLQYRKLWL